MGTASRGRPRGLTLCQLLGDALLLLPNLLLLLFHPPLLGSDGLQVFWAGRHVRLFEGSGSWGHQLQHNSAQQQLTGAAAGTVSLIIQGIS